MNKKIAVIWVSLVMIFSFVVILDVIIDFTPPVEGGIIRYVNETGTGGAYTKIQDAINASSDGDTIFVYNGIYYEHLVVNKTIYLIGEDRETTIIDGGANGDIVLITADWVNITEFTIRNSGTVGSPDYDAAIEIESDFVTIFNNNISDNSHGLHIVTHSNHHIINNTISNNTGNGIFLTTSSNNIIANNTVINNGVFGIYLPISSDNNIITNNNVSSNTLRGIYLYKSSHNNIINNIVSFNQYGIYFLDYCWFNNITNNSISSNSLDGIHSSNSGYTTIINNTISNHRFGIYLDASAHCTLKYNIFTNDGIFLRGGGGGLNAARTQTIPTNNKVNGKPVVYYTDSSNISFNGTTVGQFIIVNSKNIELRNLQINNTDVGILIAYSINVTLTNNNISNNYYGIHISRSTYNNLSDNVVFQNTDEGILFSYSDINTIVNNTILNNDEGLALYASKYSNITINDISNNNFGIYFSGATQNNITLNNITNNTEGIFLSSSGGDRIIGNNISYNSGRGIAIPTSENNYITRNNIYKNEYGIYVNWRNNLIFNNNIIDNKYQSNDTTVFGENKWDNGYPTGGNYWSDYSGVDNYKGPNQSTQGSDGIGDTPYVIYVNTQDNYPLMASYKSFENYTILYQGWNLLSIPLIQQNKNLSKVFEMIDGYYDVVQWYDITDMDDHWKHHKVNKPFGNDLSEINESIGFWIYITQQGDTIFVYNGTQPTVNQTITLHSGWNLVGYPSLKNYDRTKGLNNLTFGTHVDSIWTYNATTQKWKELGPSDYFELGRGYWIHAKTKCEWEVPL